MKNILYLIFAIMLTAQLFGQNNITKFKITPDTQTCACSPCVSLLEDGGFVVCWVTAEMGDIYCQIFNSDLSKRGDAFQVYMDINDHSFAPTLTALSDNGFVICWRSWNQDFTILNTSIQKFDSYGNAEGNMIHFTPASHILQNYFTIASLPENKFIISWLSLNTITIEQNIFAQIFDESGHKSGNQIEVYSISQKFLWLPQVTSNKNDEFIICWVIETSHQDTLNTAGYIMGQSFDLSGNKRGSAFQISNDALILLFSNPMLSLPVTHLTGYEYLVCWHSFYGFGSDGGIFGQLFNSKGFRIGGEFKVNTSTIGRQNHPSLSSLSTNGFIVTWAIIGNPGWNIIAQLFDASGEKRGNEFIIDTKIRMSSRESRVINLFSNNFLIIWSNDSGLFGKCFEYQILQLKEYLLFEPQNDATIETTCPSFYWQQPTNSIESFSWEITFELYIDDDVNFSSPQIINNIEDTTYTIDSLEPGKTYFWKVLAKNLAGDSLWSTQQDWGFFISHNATSVETSDENVPQQFELFQNYPNPFNSSTEIKYSLPQHKSSYHVTLKIYDIRGRLVNTLVDQNQTAGTYSVSWDGGDMNGQFVSSGIYFYTLQVGDYKVTKKMLLLH